MAVFDNPADQEHVIIKGPFLSAIIGAAGAFLAAFTQILQAIPSTTASTIVVSAKLQRSIEDYDATFSTSPLVLKLL